MATFSKSKNLIEDDKDDGSIHAIHAAWRYSKLIPLSFINNVAGVGDISSQNRKSHRCSANYLIRLLMVLSAYCRIFPSGAPSIYSHREHLGPAVNFA